MIAELAQGLAAGKNFLEILKVLNDFEKQTNDLTQRQLISELRKKILENQEEAFSLQEKNLSLKKTNHMLEQKLQLKEHYEFKQDMDVYVKKVGNDKLVFCKHCFHIRCEAIPLANDNPEDTENWFCVICKNHFSSIYAKKRSKEYHAQLNNQRMRY